MKTEIELDEILSECIRKWGTAQQMNMVMEECAELIQAVNKLMRNPCEKTIQNICSEVADVELMLKQLRKILNKDGVIDNIKEEKIERVKMLLFTHKINP